MKLTSVVVADRYGFTLSLTAIVIPIYWCCEYHEEPTGCLPTVLMQVTRAYLR